MARLLCFTLALGLAGPAAADVVVFRNGDRLHGTIGTLLRGRLEIGSTVVGSVSVPLSRVATFETEGEAEIHLEDGTVVIDRIGRASEGSILVAGLAVDEALALDRVREINPKYVPPVRYGGELKGSTEIDRGNTDEIDTELEFVLRRETDLDLIKLTGAYDGDRSKDQSTGKKNSTERSYELDLRYERSINDRYYGYNNNEWEKDLARALDPRIRIGTGLGYRWRNTSTIKISTEGGIAWIRRDFSDDTSDEELWAGRIAWRLRSFLTPELELFQTGEWLPSLENSDDHTIEIDGGMRFWVTRALFSEARVEWDYDSEPADEVERQDVTYKLSVGYAF